MFQGTYLTSLQQHLLIHIKIKKITVKQYTMAKKLLNPKYLFCILAEMKLIFQMSPLEGYNSSFLRFSIRMPYKRP